MKRNKNTRKERKRFVGGEHVIIKKLNCFGVVSGISRLDGQGAMLVIDLDCELRACISPLDVIRREYNGC